jgi:ABC-type uncharacterized transport system auxiliary subunit
MPGFRSIAACLAVWFATALAAGCISVGDPPLRQTFLVRLAPGAPGEAAQRPFGAAVYIAPVSVAEPFSGRSLVVRQSDVGFEVDPYAEFVASPASMWTDAVRSWLDAHRLFERVLPFDSGADASLTLEANLLEAFADRRPGQVPSSRVVIRFLLIENRAPNRVLLDRTFSRAEPVTGTGAEREVAALSLAAADVLRDFEDVLSQLPN